MSCRGSFSSMLILNVPTVESYQSVHQIGVTQAWILTMPEIPDLQNYLEAMESRLLDQTLVDLRFSNPFVLRTVEPAAEILVGRTVCSFTRIFSQIV